VEYPLLNRLYDEFKSVFRILIRYWKQQETTKFLCFEASDPLKNTIAVYPWISIKVNICNAKLSQVSILIFSYSCYTTFLKGIYRIRRVGGKNTFCPPVRRANWTPPTEHRSSDYYCTYTAIYIQTNAIWHFYF